MRRIVVTGMGAVTPLAAGAEANQARPMAMGYAISNGFGFGGVNASALFRRWTDEPIGGIAGGARD